MSYEQLSSRAIIGRFFERYEATLDGSWARSIGWMNGDSNQETETYKWLGSSPLLREWKGGRHEEKIQTYGYAISNKVYESTLDIDLEDLRRDKTGQIMVRVDETAVRAAEHWEDLMSQLIVAGETEQCFDGRPFFAPDHESGDSGVQTNSLTSAEIPSAAVANPTRPTAKEMADIITESIAYMYSFKDDRRKPINGQARSFLIMVPINFYAPAFQAISANFLSQGETNPTRGFQASGINISVLPNPRIPEWTTKFAVFRTDGQMKPFILQEEQGLQTQLIGSGSEEEFKNNRHLFGLKAIRSVGYGLWYQAELITLSQA